MLRLDLQTKTSLWFQKVATKMKLKVSIYVKTILLIIYYFIESQQRIIPSNNTPNVQVKSQTNGGTNGNGSASETSGNSNTRYLIIDKIF